MDTSRLPSIFVSHGSPMTALEPGAAGAFMQRLGARIDAQFGRPKAILAVSAHTAARAPVLLAGARHEAIYDFGGFDPKLYTLRYDAPGAPALAEKVAQLTGAAHDHHRGLDHGAWVPAMLAWPEADIPIFQLSVQPALGPAHHIALGRRLAMLREEGVLVMGSGSAIHNLRALIRSGNASDPEPWAQAFDDWLVDTLEKGDEASLADYRSRAPYAREAHPTDEHLLPLHVAYGAAGEGARGRALHRSFTLGNLSMAAYAFG